MAAMPLTLPRSLAPLAPIATPSAPVPPRPPPPRSAGVLPSAGQVSDPSSGEPSEEDYEAVAKALGGDGPAAPGGPPKSMWQLALERERVGPPQAAAAERRGAGRHQGESGGLCVCVFVRACMHACV
jgi:hypothetical protein